MDLTPLMKPKSIAVVGASQRMNRATRVIANLQRFGYGGRVYPINPRYADIHGLPCYPLLRDGTVFTPRRTPPPVATATRPVSANV